MLDPSDFLKIATLIRKEKKFPESVRYRTAINRAYYGAFTISKIKLISLGKNFGNNDQIQEQVIENLKPHDAFLADQLFSLHEERIKSDYDMDIIFKENEVSLSIQKAKFIITEIENIKN